MLTTTSESSNFLHKTTQLVHQNGLSLILYHTNTVYETNSITVEQSLAT